MSTKKYSRDQINRSLTSFTRAARTEYSGDAYACGALVTLLTNAMVDMPLYKQTEILQVLDSLIIEDIAL